MPHLHRAMESRSSCSTATPSASAGAQIVAGPGSYVLVPRGPCIAARGRWPVLVLMVPEEGEDMFWLGELGADNLRDPAVRAAIRGYDSVPVR